MMLTINIFLKVELLPSVII